MPRLKLSSRESVGPLVTTSGQVISGAGSPGQQVWIGSAQRSMSSPFSTISWQAGARSPSSASSPCTVLASGSSSNASLNAARRFGLAQHGQQFADFAQAPWRRCGPTPPRVTPMATRFTVPNRLTSTGMSDARAVGFDRRFRRSPRARPRPAAGSGFRSSRARWRRARAPAPARPSVFKPGDEIPQRAVSHADVELCVRTLSICDGAACRMP